LPDKVDFLIFVLSFKGNVQDKLVNAKENNRSVDAAVSREQNIPEVCFPIKYNSCTFFSIGYVTDLQLYYQCK